MLRTTPQEMINPYQPISTQNQPYQHPQLGQSWEHLGLRLLKILQGHRVETFGQHCRAIDRFLSGTSSTPTHYNPLQPNLQPITTQHNMESLHHEVGTQHNMQHHETMS